MTEAYVFRLHADWHGVTHWRYASRAVILVCGSNAFRGDLDIQHDTFPTCLWCISIMDSGRAGSGILKWKLLV